MRGEFFLARGKLRKLKLEKEKTFGGRSEEGKSDKMFPQPTAERHKVPPARQARPPPRVFLGPFSSQSG